jgi:nitrile hydratase accessory protein
MQTRFEHFALGSMMGAPDVPPKANGSLCFGAPWERTAFGVALALAKQGIFDWEEFREEMVATIAAWESAHAIDDPSWNYYEIWLSVLERMVANAGYDRKRDLAPTSWKET